LSPRRDTPKLERYRAKRSADRTPEPFGGDTAAAPAPSTPDAAPEAWARPRLFCVQKHAATRLHYDFRLELGGVLLSWAVPKGPSPDPADKRLAVEVEDHPVEYADFEGLIPEGNYGAGAVIVWDKGVWIPREDPEAGMKVGKLLFELRGYKLRGLWHLFRTKKQEQARQQEWLLIKKPDAWSGAEAARAVTPESIYSGLTLEELRDGSRRADEIRGELARLGAPRKRVDVDAIGLMLAETRSAPFSGDEWVFELKYDGYRLLGSRRDGSARLLFRRGSEATSTFPEIARAVAGLPYDVILDGEVVVLDDAGRPSFQRLQKRALLKRDTDVARQAVLLPATLFVFDLLAFEGHDLRGLPLVERKALLARILPRAGALRYSDHVEAQGEAFYREIERLRLEGMVAKRAVGPYRAGRSSDWLKVRLDATGDFVVVGTSPGEGRRTGFGALHLAAWDRGELVYAGRVGSGFSEADLKAIPRRLAPLRRTTPPCSGAVPKGAGHVWVEAEEVCEVRYKEWTGEHLLRQPVFLRFRDDKKPEDCVREGNGPIAEALPEEPPPPAKTGEKKVAFSNLDKVFWPDEGYTKGDLIEYYRVISPWLLPYLADRPVVLTRYPDGIHGKNFFQKDAPGFTPGWLRTERMWSEHAQREIDYFVVDDALALVYLANLGTIPLHIWSSRVASLAMPDWCILDFDPKGAPFADVVTLTRSARELCDEMGVAGFPKTSGSTGLHVLIPLGRQLTYEQSRSFGELMARVLVERHPDLATVIRTPSQRGGKVYVDFLQNGHGRLLVAPFSVRPVPGARVSMPLRWEAVTGRLDPNRFTIRTVPKLLAKSDRDPMRRVLEETPDLPRALARLAERLGESS
jgi:bifunctional non-homologous end joining protein LigD